MKYYKSRVSEYDNKLKRMKRLKKENDERESVLNVRKSLDLTKSRKNDTDMTDEYIKSATRNAREMNKHFENLQNAKEEILNSKTVKIQSADLKITNDNENKVSYHEKRKTSNHDSVPSKNATKANEKTKIIKTRKEMMAEKLEYE